MIQHNVKQGSDGWLQLRLTHFTASEASAMLGLSSYMTRTELLTLKKTGVAKEVDAQTQRRFDAGHASEAMARPLVENNIGEELYPVTGSLLLEGLPLLASFDGLTMMEDVVFEHKIINSNLVESVSKDIIPKQYMPQLEQQLMVSGAREAIFVVSDGTSSNMYESWYESDPDLRKQIILGWKQFAKDLEEFEITPEEVKPETKALIELPALSISIMGKVSSSNLAVYESTALDYIKGINTDLQTDEDFANAEVNIKFCDQAEKELEAVKKQALGQTADIDMLFKTVDHLKEEMRSKRLTLNKLVKSQKETLKIKIVQDGQEAICAHIREIDSDLKCVKLPSISSDFGGAIKGKRNLSSMRNAVDTELSTLKIKANEMAANIFRNLGYIDSISDYKFLFNDLQDICVKNNDDFINLVDSRVSRHKQAEEKRLEAEREKIRQEEQRKAEQEAQAKIEAERKKAEAERIDNENIERAKQREEDNKIALKCAEQSKIKQEPAQKIEPVAEQAKPIVVNHQKQTLKLTDREKSLVIAAYINGYERGHDDTVESCYSDAEASAIEWLEDSLDDGGLLDHMTRLTEQQAA